MTAKTLSVPGIHCDHCKMSIEKAVGELNGVDAVAVNIEAGTVELSFNDETLGLDQIIDAIEEVGYEVPR